MSVTIQKFRAALRKAGLKKPTTDRGLVLTDGVQVSYVRGAVTSGTICVDVYAETTPLEEMIARVKSVADGLGLRYDVGNEMTLYFRQPEEEVQS